MGGVFSVLCLMFTSLLSALPRIALVVAWGSVSATPTAGPAAADTASAVPACTHVGDERVRRIEADIRRVLSEP